MGEYTHLLVMELLMFINKRDDKRMPKNCNKEIMKVCTQNN